MTVIYVKPGTHPGTYFRVKYLRREPKVGEVFKAKPWDINRGRFVEKWEKWSQWRVCEIRGNLFCLERW